MKTSKQSSEDISSLCGGSLVPVKIPSLRLQFVHYYRHISRRQPGTRLLLPYQELVELMVEGIGWVMHEGEWREVLPGEIIWHKPGDRTIGRTDFENPYECLCVMVQTPKRNGLGLPRFSHWKDVGEVHTFSAETQSAFRSESFDRDVLRDYVIGRLLFQVRLFHNKVVNQALPLPLQQVVEVMEQGFAEECRIESLAKEVGWSAAHLHDEFRRHMGTTPHQWLIQRRLRAAKERLVASVHPIKQIAVECGFADTAAFTHAFTKAMGLPPRQYREQSVNMTSMMFRK